MKITPRFASLIAAIGLAIAAAATQATTEPPAATRNEIADSWLGGVDAGVHARLELDKRGKGYVAVQWASGDRIALYEIKATKLTGHSINLSTRPTPGWKQITVTGRAYKEMLYLRFQVVGAPSGYSLLMERESEATRRTKALEKRISSARHLNGR